MRLIRAHDGVAFEFSQQHLQAIDGLAAFFQLIAETIQIEASQIILMNPLGSQLTQNLLNSIIHQSTQDQSSSNSSDTLLYAFDRQFLSADPSEALNALACQPEHLLQLKPPPFEPNNATLLDPEELEQLTHNYHQVGANHLRTSLLLLTHVRAQKSALEVALNNLDKCREPPQGALEAYETFAQPLVQDYGQLLEAFGPSFALAKRVKIHPALLPSNALLKSNSSQSVSNTATNATTTSTGMMKVKYMGDYVMEDKILQIRDKCLKVYEDFRNRFEMIRARSTEVNEGAAKLREELNGGDCDLDDLYELEKDADDGFRRIEDLTAQIAQLARDVDPIDGLIDCFNELIVLDEDSRERIACLIERKNFWLHYLVDGLNQISRLQSIIPSIGVELQALNSDLKTRTDPFRYLARLKDFVTAYASTVVEVVRRREYARHLADYASALNNLVSKLANDERRRRGVYRTEYAGKLPFAVEGLDDNSVPTIEFEIRYIGGGGAIVPKSKDTSSKATPITGADLPPLTRADVDELVAGLQNIEDSSDNSSTDSYSPKVPAREVRLLVEKQFSRLEAMENAFAAAVEKFVMSESESCIAGQPVDAEEVSQLKARVAELEAAQENLTERLRAESTAAITTSRKAQQETQIHIRKTEDLKLQLLSVKEEARHEKERLTQDQQPLITELANASETIERLNERIGQLEDELKSRTKSLQDTERQVTSARATADDATRELHDLEARHRDHVSDHEIVLNRLQQSRDRCTELERGLADCQSRNQTLSGQVEDQTKLMASRTSEAEELRERMEKEISELKARLEDEKQQNCNLQNKVTQQEIEIGHITQQSKLLAEAHTAAESRWKDETMTATSCLENHCRSAVQALKSYQQVHRTVRNKIINMPRPGSSQKSAVTPGPSNASHPTGEATGSDNLVGVDPGSKEEEEELPSPLSPEFEALLQSLLQFDHESMVDLVHQKLDQLSGSIRKWMKDCKGYRERANRSQEQAQVKITFRDFAKGDLALFLPTRNPSAQVWAAFNVSFPHYFLQANETVAPIIKSREWLVARIVSLTEKMVDPKEPETNPYQLPAGTRYFLLEVEPWSVEKTSRKMAQSMIGGDSPARPKMQNQMRSTTLPSQTAPQATSSALSKRRSFVAEADNTPQPITSSARVEGGHSGASETTKPSSDPLDSTSNTQANSNVDLTQSEYTVIDRASSPGATEPSSDSPFRTSLSSSIIPTRSSLSGLSLSLKTYQKSPLGAVPASSPSPLQPLTETDSASIEGAPEFKPSESARPAFLASLSHASPSSSSSAPRKMPGAFQPPSKPRLRPVPKAHNASRSSSRAPSIASSANLNPAVKALLMSGSPSSKGPSTVSTTFTSMEKDPTSIHPSRSPSGGGEQQVAGLAQIIKPRSGGSPGGMSMFEIARRRLSFSSPTNNYPISSIHHSAGGGPSGSTGASGSQNSLGSSSGSALIIGHPPHTPINRLEAQTIPEPSRSSPVTHNHHQHHNQQSVILASPSSVGATATAGLTGSGFFSAWRRRKESLSNPPSIPSSSSLPPPPHPPPSSSHANTLPSVQSPSSSSFVAADLLKRLSGAVHPPNS
ncbi:oligomeric, coiled-coil, peripheral membrane protein [Puccinia graminis f. sp. tritici]|uniref:Autophagy-related protein 11 n=1 Tax=Puccinia graminis f. sp. tritici TaxID=56615 RepID=A0A5B0NZV8_PUCGR|nr:oligomeric, coiled-coil, peripheral membrane protein [Puccinia graminis f. sp. tritici]KAA1094791.1 oligomeric, coiled-coil, peripheral membrane protein [Puccinia graminis f. sp. tritici]